MRGGNRKQKMKNESVRLLKNYLKFIDLPLSLYSIHKSIGWTYGRLRDIVLTLIKEEHKYIAYSQKDKILQQRPQIMINTIEGKIPGEIIIWKELVNEIDIFNGIFNGRVGIINPIEFELNEQEDLGDLSGLDELSLAENIMEKEERKKISIPLNSKSNSRITDQERIELEQLRIMKNDLENMVNQIHSYIETSGLEKRVKKAKYLREDFLSFITPLMELQEKHLFKDEKEEDEEKNKD